MTNAEYEQIAMVVNSRYGHNFSKNDVALELTVKLVDSSIAKVVIDNKSASKFLSSNLIEDVSYMLGLPIVVTREHGSYGDYLFCRLFDCSYDSEDYEDENEGE